MIQETPSYKPFNPLKVHLRGSNLIQASAGTGKTYSISVLVLRMIMEEDIPINEILMVTFTNAAVAELEERVRDFILEAYRYIKGAETEITEIKIIIDKLKLNTKEHEIEKRIKDTLLLLDEIQIFTINSFCQNLLTEYAFETGQLFSSQILVDQKPFMLRFSNEFWRKEITTLPRSLLETIAYPIQDSLVISGDKYDTFSKGIIDDIIIKSQIEIDHFKYNQNINIDQISADLEQKLTEYHALIERGIDAFKHNEEEIIGSIKNKSFRDKICSSQLDIGQKFALAFNAYYFKPQTKYIQNISDKIIEHFTVIYHAKIELHNNIRETQNHLIGKAIKFVLEKLSQYKKDHNLMSFNDTILNLYNALQNPETLRKIKLPYKAFFVDEFQDTDAYQYAIFKSLFQNRSTQFYIGDPKQSIYGFRGADLDTYMSAIADMEYLYTMTINYRSTKNLINAVNEIYGHIDNPFDDRAIDYDQVSQGRNHGSLITNDQLSTPVSIINYGNQNQIIEGITKEIQSLLTEDHFIQKEGTKRRIKPNDVAILTRNKKIGKKLKLALSKKNIAAVQLAESNIFNSDEALWVSHIFQAILRPTTAFVNRAIFHPATGINQKELIEIEPDFWIESFNQLRITLNKEGIYPALMSFLSVFNIKAMIQKNQIEGGDRIIGNYYQLTEIIHEAEKYKSLYNEELLQWFIQQLSTEDTIQQEDIKAERIESDEDAVQIMTIHKSKGLTYNIVLFVDVPLISVIKTDKVINYKEASENARLMTKYPDENQISIHHQQNKKEAYRLLYVAITRGVYKIIVFTKTGSAFNSYLNELPHEISSKWFVEIDSDKKYKPYYAEIPTTLRDPLKFKGSVFDNWGVLSFSSISTHGGLVEKDEIEINNQLFDDFVFHSWGKGAVHGNFIHDTLEEIDFSSDKGWIKVINKQSLLYPTIYNEDHLSYYEKFLEHIVNTPLSNNGFSLKDIEMNSRISEMEFYYNLTDVHLNKIKLLIPDIDIEKNIRTNGIMHGFIDLFFEHNGKYYILDWKSNYLGNHLEAYSSDKLYRAMTINNYHLQYWVYTIAIKRYLERNIPNFDYERDFGGVFYIFVRGVRKNKNTGVFYTKPKIEILEKIDNFK